MFETLLVAPTELLGWKGAKNPSQGSRTHTKTSPHLLIICDAAVPRQPLHGMAQKSQDRGHLHGTGPVSGAVFWELLSWHFAMGLRSGMRLRGTTDHQNQSVVFKCSYIRAQGSEWALGGFASQSSPFAKVAFLYFDHGLRSYRATGSHGKIKSSWVSSGNKLLLWIQRGQEWDSFTPRRRRIYCNTITLCRWLTVTAACESLKSVAFASLLLVQLFIHGLRRSWCIQFCPG